MHTLKTLASYLGDLDGRDEAGIAELHAQLRNLYAKGLIKAVREPGAGKTAAVRIDAREAARARILTVLIDLGFDLTVLSVVNDALNAPIDWWGQPPSSAKGDGFNISNGGLSDVLRGIEADEEWSLNVDLYRKAIGLREVIVSFTWPQDEKSEDASELVNAYYGRTPLSRVVTSLKPLLSKLQRE